MMIMKVSLLIGLLGCLLPVGSNAFSSSVSTAAATTASTAQPELALADFDYTTQDRLPYLQDGYNQWKWRDHTIDYIEMGDRSKPALLLIHGFGASAYHFRFNIPELARDYNVYAFDMLGFGLSDKPLVDYNAEVWRDQACDFIQEVIGKECTVAGNSLGGFTALYTSTVDEVKPMIKGCVLLNGAGRFRPDEPELEEEEPNQFVENIKAALQRLVIQASFIYTKQPARIEQVLRQVYPINADAVDPELVESIQYPSFDPNAAEVFYRVITRTSGQKVYVDDLLEKLDCPLLLCWGEEDPWIRPAAADKIQLRYPTAQRVSIDAGHCPHDEDAPAVNAAIRDFMKQVH